MRTLSLLLVATLLLAGCPKDPDDDGDGFAASEDCDDGDAAVFPGADELCNEVDDDCDGDVDEEATDKSSWYEDQDGDGYGDPETERARCDQAEGTVAEGTDCDDGDAAVSPGADELCNGIDDDCDGTVDEDDAVDAPTWYADADGDGYGTDATATASCTRPEGHVDRAGDCDDTEIAANPGMWERCNDFDDDCDGTVDEDDAVDAPRWYFDTDLDGWGQIGDEEAYTRSCDDPGEGHSPLTGDCDDDAADVYPDADEWCDEVDHDCDGDVHAGAVDAPTWHPDADGDGFGDETTSLAACEQPAGYLADGTDCLDSEADAYPGSIEVCDDSIDQDCDGTADSGCHCGVISADETWAASTLHIVWCDIAVYGTAEPTLTIEDGATVLFEVDSGLTVGEDGAGALAIAGTSSGVLLSSYESSPAEGDWDGVEFGDFDTGSSLEGVTVEYGGGNGFGALYVDGADVEIADCVVQYSGSDGIRVASGEPAITGTEVSWNDGDGVDASGGGLDTGALFEENEITSNQGYPLVLPAAYAITLDDSSTFTGNLDDTVVLEADTITLSGTVPALDVPYSVGGRISIHGSASPEVSIADGAELEFSAGGELYVGYSGAGSLVVDGGTSGVLMTSTSSSPTAGDWDGLTFGAYDQGSQLTGLLLEYAGRNGYGCVHVDDADLVIDDSAVGDCAYHGVYAEGSSTLAITDSTFEDCALDGVYVASSAALAADASPTFTGNTLQDNGAWPLSLPAGSVGMLGASNTLDSNGSDEVRVFADTVEEDATWLDQGVPFLLTGDVTVEGSAEPTLTLDDGVEIAFDTYAGLTVGSSAVGSLVVEATTSGAWLYGDSTTAGTWDGVTLGQYTDTAWLEGVTLQHGGATGYGCIRVDGADLTVVDSTVDTCAGYGFYVGSGSLDLDGVSLTDNQGFGVSVATGAEVIAMTACDVSGSDDHPVLLPPDSVGALDATNTFSSNGTDAVLVRAGTVSADATWLDLGVPYELAGTVDVYGSASPTLEIEEGTTLEFARFAGLWAGLTGAGSLWAVGTSSEPVVFTSAEAAPGAGDWGGLYLGEYCDSTLSVLGYVTVEYGGANGRGNVVFDECDGTISDSTVAYSSRWGIYVDNASPSVSDVTYDSNASGTITP